MSSALEIGSIPEQQPLPTRSLEVEQTAALGHEALAPEIDIVYVPEGTPGHETLAQVIDLIPVPEGTPPETYFFIGNNTYFLCRDGSVVPRDNAY